MPLKSWGKEDDIPVGKSIAEVQFIVASVYEIKVETFNRRVAKGPDEAGIGGMIDFATELPILLNNLAPHYRNITHL